MIRAENSAVFQSRAKQIEKDGEIMKRAISLFTALIMVLSFTSCGLNKSATAVKTVSVTDCAGRAVEVPADPQSICTLCPYTGMLITVLGFADRVTSTCNNVARSNLLNEIRPEIGNAVVVKNSGDINAEEILNLNTDLIFAEKGVLENSDQLAKLETMGIPYVLIGFETLEEQFEATRVIGNALGVPEKAEKYIEYFRDTIDSVKEKSSLITAKKNVYHSVNEAVRTDNKGSYCDLWIELTGALNVSAQTDGLRIEGNKSYTTLEQIYIWNPDIIICNEALVDDYILSDPKWTGLDAVINRQVYQIPIGVTRWGHPTSIETPLAIMWLAQLLYPEIYDYDIDAEIRNFYKEFFSFDISDEWLEAIKGGNNMRTPKTNKAGE